MASTLEGKITAALKARTVALATALSLPLDWDGWDFTPPAIHKWLDATHQPNFTDREAIGSDEPHRYVGILMVSIYYPHGGGEPALRDIAGQIIAYFPCDYEVPNDDGLTIRITKRPQAAGLLKDDQDMHIAVSIEYEVFG